VPEEEEEEEELTTQLNITLTTSANITVARPLLEFQVHRPNLPQNW